MPSVLPLVENERRQQAQGCLPHPDCPDDDPFRRGIRKGLDRLNGERPAFAAQQLQYVSQSVCAMDHHDPPAVLHRSDQKLCPGYKTIVSHPCTTLFRRGRPKGRLVIEEGRVGYGPVEGWEVQCAKSARNIGLVDFRSRLDSIQRCVLPGQTGCYGIQLNPCQADRRAACCNLGQYGTDTTSGFDNPIP